MELSVIISLIERNDIQKLISCMDSYCGTNAYKESIKKYEVKNHDVMDKAKRPDKLVKGEDQEGDTIVQVARIPIPEQKRIVKLSAAFMGVPALNGTAKNDAEKNMLTIINAINSDNKMEYNFRSILKMTMSETECAELWYPVETEEGYYDGLPMKSKYKLRVRLLAPSLGDALYPIFDKFNDLIAFGRGYVIKTHEEDGREKDIERLDVYTADKIYYLQKEGQGDWAPVKIQKTGDERVSEAGIVNIFKKIPVVYYSQPAPEWQDVENLIDRLEKKVSNHADTNDYFDSPIVLAKGDVKGFTKKGEQGKVLELGSDADVSYLTWDSLPESKKMEDENLNRAIAKYTHTPDISLDNLKSIGALSGIALRTFFMDAHLKASDKEEIFGIGVTRRINFLKSAVAILDSRLKQGKRVNIKPVFTYFLPKDIQGEITSIVSAVNAGIISKESAVKINPLVEDWESELEKINQEEEKKTKQQQDNIVLPGIKHE